MSPTDHRRRHRAERDLHARPLILVLHQSPTVRQALLVTLDLHGFDVVVTGDPSEAVALLNYALPSVVIADLAIAGIDCMELLERLSANHEPADVPIIVFEHDRLAPRFSHFSVNGVHHVRREDGVGRLLEVLGSVAGPSRSPGGDRPAA